MRKLITLFTLGLLSLGCLCGCNSSDYIAPQTNNNLTSNRFVCTGTFYNINNHNWKEVVDTKTNNLYIIRTDGYQCGMSPIYDEEGNIAKYNE